jgi:hypothetical protein
MHASVMDQCVRLAFAIILIVLVSFGLYQFASRANAFAPAEPVIGIAK